MKGLCEHCEKLYNQKMSDLDDYCLHCRELVLKSFLYNEEKRDDSNA